MIRVAFVGEHDYAICAQRAAEAINVAAGSPVATAITTHLHRFEYPGQNRVPSLEQAIDAAIRHLRGSARPWVFAMYDRWPRGVPHAAVRIARIVPNCRLGRLHIGTTFRSHHEALSRQDAAMGVSLRFVSPDSMRLCGQSVVPTRPYLHTVPRLSGGATIGAVSGPVRVCHSPSSALGKGSATIRGIVEGLQKRVKFEFNEISGLSYSRCVEERSGHHVFIGQHAPEVGGFGYSSVEAMAQGMVALTTMNNSPPSVWLDAGLEPPPVVDLSEDALLRLIVNAEALREARGSALAYVTTGQMSPAAAGKYYLRELASAHGQT